MKRLLLTLVLALLGITFVIWALLVPAHLRAVDGEIVRLAGRKSAPLVQEGLSLVHAGKIGPARLLARFAEQEALPGAHGLQRSLQKVTDPSLLAWGCAAPDLTNLFHDDPRFEKPVSKPIFSWLIGSAARREVLQHLQASQRYGVREILRTLALTNVVHFSPAGSPSGQPMEAVTLLAGLLIQGDHLSASLRERLESLAFAATRKGEVQPLELVYLDLLSLGNKLDWSQLTYLLRRLETLKDLRDMANLMRFKPESLPVIYSAVVLAPSARSVLDYIMAFGGTGLPDLRLALRWGAGAVGEAVKLQRPIHYSRWRERLVAYEPFYSGFKPMLRLAERSAGLALLIKYGLLLVGGFFLALAARVLAPSVAGLAGGRRLLNTHQVVLTSLFLLVLLTIIEPFLVQTQKALEFPLQKKSKVVVKTAQAKVTAKSNVMMDTFTLGSLLAFLFIQAGIYALCLSKLAEIRRQPVSTKVKLKLLENEENMFDLGLYAGLGGTVGSLVLLTMGIVKPSFMAAYASTLFGIVFVALLKVCHLRPYRKSLILSTEPNS